jgi:hypothetical protein
MSLRRTPRSVVEHALEQYHDEAQGAIALLGEWPEPAHHNYAATENHFVRAFELPPLDDAMCHFLSAAQAAIVDMGTYQGRTLRLLDMRRNPAPGRTRSFPRRSWWRAPCGTSGSTGRR